MMEVSMVWLSQLSRSFLRDRLISLVTLASILANPCALAQDQARMRQVPAARTDGSEQEIIVENALAISKMSLGMSVDPTGDADRDFVALMMPHHQGAIDIARAELKYGHNEELRRLAQNIIAEREHEMSVMHSAVGEASPSQKSDVPTSTNSEHPAGGRHQQE
jgi:uncharacterized protein (DUF305 family)